MTTKVCFLLLGIFLAVIEPGVGIKCWTCRSDVNPECGHPFNNRTFSITDCKYTKNNFAPDIQPTMCRKYQQIIDGKPVILRGCGISPHHGVQNDEYSGVGPCPNDEVKNTMMIDFCEYCNQDGCNGAPSFRLGVFVAVPFVISLLW